DGLRHPPNDRLSVTLDEHSNSRWEEPMVRPDRYVHAEFQADGGGGEPPAREYIRAWTKWNGYSFNAQAFIDLVTDEVVMEGERRPRQRIKLRVVSRQELSPLVGDANATATATATTTSTGGSVALVLRKRIRDREGQEMEDGDRAFTASRVALWPPDDAPQDLHEILCPEGQPGDVKAMLGDEGIVYMAGPPRAPGSAERALVFVGFDPTFGFQGMQRLDGSPAVPKSEKKRKVDRYELNETPQSVSLESQGQSQGQGMGIDLDPADRTKRLKLGAQVKLAVGDSTSARSRGDEQGDLAVLPQGHNMAQALIDESEDWQPPLASRAELPAMSQPQRPLQAAVSSPSPSPSRDDLSQWQTSGKPGRGKAPAPPNLGQTRQERVMYMSIGRGYWLR
ncbi:uncharacterized protein PV07_12764, partial [Cladophialophora immunda]